MKQFFAVAAVLLPVLAGAETIVHDGSTVTIRVDVPALGVPNYDASVSRRLRAEAAQFRRWAEEMREPGDESWPVFEMTVTTDAYRAKGLDFVVIETYQFHGGAHGRTAIEVEAVDSKGKILSFPDLFEETRALAALSKRSLTELFLDPDLKDELNREDVEEGVAPEADNFSAIYLDGETLIVTFAEYQVGYYGLGNPGVRIPCKELLGVMKPVLARACRAAGRAGRR